MLVRAGTELEMSSHSWLTWPTARRGSSYSWPGRGAESPARLQAGQAGLGLGQEGLLPGGLCQGQPGLGGLPAWPRPGEVEGGTVRLTVCLARETAGGRPTGQGAGQGAESQDWWRW